jgi:peroxiredoxin
MAEVPSTFQLKPGDAAPAFTLPDPSGRTHSLADVAGPEGLLVIFACNHCPFVVHLADGLAAFAAECRAKGVGVVAISSNDVDNYPQDAPDKMAVFAATHGWTFPYLYDATQEAAQAYAAACTPDFFLFDKTLRLFYAGQFDGSRPGNGKPVTGADLRAALEAMTSGQPAPSHPRPSTGCNIKWKPGLEPAWFRRRP